ncbi:MAG: head decoration protein [Schwartzia sp.]|nr:head decoration protein [Schwartzia sp. (in: firmicutes)]
MAFHEKIPNATSYDELLAGPEVATLTKNIKLQSGKAYKRGMLISLVKLEGETAATAELGKQTAAGDVAEYVLMRDVDATEADAVGTVYVKGRFNREKIILSEGDTVDAHEAELRLRDIHFTALMS